MNENQIIVDKKKATLSFFVFIAVIGVLAVLIGFGKTFIVPTAEGTFKAPVVIHIHGAFAFTWILLFLIQTLLIHSRRYRLHQTLGILGFMIAIGVSVTMVLVGKYVVIRDLNQGLGDFAYSSFPGVVTSSIMFFFLVLLGVLNRETSSPSHKRFMLLATIVVLWPAWFRFRHYFPSVPRPDIWFAIVLAYSFIIIAWIWDKLRNGSIHSVLKWGGLFIIVEQTFEVFAFDSPAWRSIAKWLYYSL
jgi:hypothetical protein